MQKENLFKQAQELITDFREQKKMSNNKIAHKIGISSAMLTFINTNQVDNVSEEMLLRVINSLRPQSKFNILGTSNYNTVQQICRDTITGRKMSAVIGYTGAGKSTALYEFYRGNKDVFYVECKNSMNRKQFIYKILSEMGINFMGTVYDMVNMVIEELNTRSNPLLIIDEAGKVSTNVILDLHDIRNATIHNAGIVLAGCEYFQTNLKKLSDKDKTGYPEFYSRVVNWHILNRPTKAEIIAICKKNGVENDDTIKDFLRIPNYRQLYNAITNERSAEHEA